MSSLVVLAGLAALASSSSPVFAAPVPGTACALFPANNVWNMDVSNLPVHAKSRTWLRSTHSDSTLLHLDFGGAPYGLPYDVVDGSHARVDVDFRYANQSDPGRIRSDPTSTSKPDPTSTRSW